MHIRSQRYQAGISPSSSVSNCAVVAQWIEQLFDVEKVVSSTLTNRTPMEGPSLRLRGPYLYFKSLILEGEIKYWGANSHRSRGPERPCHDGASSGALGLLYVSYPT